MTRLVVRDERWPINGAFTLSRGSKTEAHVVVVELHEGGQVGRGECVPYGRYGETVGGVMAAIEAQRGAIEGGLDRVGLQDLMPPGAARNAVDCALWDLEAKQTGVPAYQRAGRARLDPVKTCFTISLGTPEKMADDARAAARRPMLKLKIGGSDDLACVEAVRAAAPKTRLVVDANEGLSFEELRRLLPDFERLGVLMVEQPLQAGGDEALEGFQSPVTLCADESLHLPGALAVCARRYGAVNIKLDKTGGLTEALRLTGEARALGLEIMAGCMVATSLSMAPAMIIAQGAAVVDLDGPLLLARDREPGLRYDGSVVFPPEPELWVRSMWTRRVWMGLAAVGGFLSVAIGAFAAHGVSDPRAVELLKTGATYGFMHSMATIACAVFMNVGGMRARFAPAFFLSGAVIFSGSLFAMAAGAPRWFGAITPIGGILFLIGWAVLIWSAMTIDTADRP